MLFSTQNFSNKENNTHAYYNTNKTFKDKYKKKIHINVTL